MSDKQIICAICKTAIIDEGYWTDDVIPKRPLAREPKNCESFVLVGDEARCRHGESRRQGMPCNGVCGKYRPRYEHRYYHSRCYYRQKWEGQF